jgi:tRNA dimethylallyltransferase
MERPRVVVVSGPTASGKTDWAVELALQFDGEIVNADSMQVYRYMDIGTAKPSPALRAKVAHHLIDVVDPDDTYSAGRYAEAAHRAIATILARGKTPIVTGGTGLYIRALLEGLLSDARADPELRAELEGEHARAVEEGDPERLYRRLRECDPATAAQIHARDVRRTVRALEIAARAGDPASVVRRAHGFEDHRYDSLYLALDPGRDVLRTRIDARCEAMIEAGLLREVRDLLERGYGPRLPSMQAIGYRHLIPVAEGRETLVNACADMQRDTKRFARRQRTWLRGVDDVVWVEPDQDDRIRGLVETFLAENGDQST